MTTTDDRGRVRRRRRGPLPARPRRVVDARRRSRPSSTPATTPSSTGCRSPPTSTRSPTRSPGRSTPSAVGGSPARRGRRWRRSAGTQRSARRARPPPTDVVQPRRPRPRHPPVPHGPPRRGSHARPTVADEIRRAWDVSISLAADDRRPACATIVDRRRDGEISFQDYFVRLHHDVRRGRAVHLRRRRPAQPGRSTALETADVVVIAPSNPLVSIGPIRALPGVDELLRRTRDRSSPCRRSSAARP